MGLNAKSLAPVGLLVYRYNFRRNGPHGIDDSSASDTTERPR